MFFITKKDSDTGKKFTAYQEKAKECLAAVDELKKELGFSSYRGAYWSLAGGVSAVCFKTFPDKKIWKNVNGVHNEWMPRLKSKEGKELQAKFDNLPRLQYEDLNACVGVDDPISHLGFTLNDEYFGIEISDSWYFFNKPEDCEEVTFTKYDELFNVRKR